jgi:hypothetical protein
MAIIDINEVRNGAHNGKIVWICDYRYTDTNQKASRAVPPTRVLIRDCSETKTNVYYSESFFSPLNKDDEPLAKVIKPFDNTGYRSYAGIPLTVFETEDECVAHFRTQCNEAIQLFERAKLNVVKGYDIEIEKLKDLAGIK